MTGDDLPAGVKPSATSRSTRPGSWTSRAAAAGLGVLLAALLVPTAVLEQAERRTQDLRFRLRGPRPTKARIVLAELRDSTLARWHEPLHAWGSHYAAAIRQARLAGARWIGMDVIPAVSGGKGPDQDLMDALRGGQVVLSNSRPAGRTPINPLDRFLWARREQSLDLGFVDAPREVDAVARRAAVFLRAGAELVPSFTAVFALRLQGRSPADRRALLSLAGPRDDVPGLGAIWINYVGPPGSFPRIGLEDLANGRLSARQRAELKDAVILIGRADSLSGDWHRGPNDQTYAGVEVHAHALATLVDRRGLRRFSPGQEMGLIMALGAVAAVPIVFLPFAWGTVWALLAAGGWSWLCTRAFGADALWPMVGPAFAIGLAWVGQSGTRVVQEARRRRRVETVFGQHVSRAVVDRLLRHPDAAALGGERREVTILFSDIRDFTPRSEEESPEKVVAQLNEYLGAMAACVFRHDGTLDKYIGDGVMAFWNSPMPQADHALRGVATAWAMLQTLRCLNDRWQSLGQKPLRIGIGLNTGEVLVGNLGSETRMNYTVIGHAVNMAARIEAANKELETSLLLGETTYEQVRPWVTARPHEVVLKGVAKPVCVYELTEFSAPPSLSIEAKRVDRATSGHLRRRQRPGGAPTRHGPHRESNS
jgi:adenylate cyclase